MKRILCLLLVIAFAVSLLALSSCGKNDGKSAGKTTIVGGT